MSEQRTPEHFWYAVGPLTDEEASRAGGTPPEIVGVEVQADDDGPAETYHIATFDNEKDRDRAVECRNAMMGMGNPSADLARLRAELDAANKRAEEAVAELVGALDEATHHMNEVEYRTDGGGGIRHELSRDMLKKLRAIAAKHRHKEPPHA